MVTYLTSLLIFCALVAQLPINTGIPFWVSFFVFAYIFTYPKGPYQQTVERWRLRKQGTNKKCERCESTIKSQDSLCKHCMLELSVGGRY